MSICKPSNRNIFIVDFLSERSKPFLVDKRFCGFQQSDVGKEIKYNLVYIPVKETDWSLESLSEYTQYFNDRCSTMVIYYEHVLHEEDEDRDDEIEVDEHDEIEVDEHDEIEVDEDDEIEVDEDDEIEVDEDEDEMVKILERKTPEPDMFSEKKTPEPVAFNFGESELLSLERLNKFLEFMEMYPISKTMFVSSYNYKDLSEGDFLFRDNFYGTRVINLRRGPDLGFRTACGDGAICDYSQEDNRPERLTCAPWFKRFLSTAFECGKGRLLQKSGTCYMTTVFNMFLLGKYLRHILVSKMNNYVSTHPSTIDDITLPIVTKCPLINDPEAVSIYTFRLLYSTLCDIDVFKKIVKRPPYVDIFSEGAHAYFQPKLTSTGGGWAFNVLYKVFHTLGINFKIAGIDADRDMAVMEPVDIEQNVLRSKYHNQLFFDNIYMQNITKRSADGSVLRDTPIEECDCMIIYNDTGSIIQPVSESQADAYLRSKNFEPEVCAIVIDSTDTGPGHVVMGFRCEDEYKIFDSNGRILEYDWYTGTKDEMKIMGKDLKTPYPTLSDTNIHLSFAIYINSAKKAQIEREGSKCFDGKKVL